MHERIIKLDTGSPEWTAQQELDSFALALARSLSTLRPESDVTQCVHTGLAFVLDRLERTSLFSREELDALIQRSVGMCAVLLDIMVKHFEYVPTSPPPRYDTLCLRSINDLHKIYLSLSDLAIERSLANLRTTHENLKGNPT